MKKSCPNPWLSLFAWLLPASKFKRSLLRALGNEIAESSTIGPTLVLSCGRFSVGENSIIGSGNVFRRIAAVEMGRGCIFGNFNQVVAAPEFQEFSPLVGRLIMGNSVIVTNRHYLDVSGIIVLRDNSGLGGVRSIFQSHEIDLSDNVTKVGRIELGPNAMSATRCTMLMDSLLPERSVLAAGSLMTKARDGDALPLRSLYAGTPARPIRELSDFAWWERPGHTTAPQPFDDSKFAVD